ncbi:helix-turn-helix domain-containing protein [Eubacterium xylanophilum]|uniref:helix-turn-helix domain-containing protein n=1 Tax=Eubacterium xylanophilum TaxID=39497 RepID=UPI0004B96B9B|nr:helix-turn-helix transcriptional regulator [Eubacterium xylanophilum]
MTFGEKLKEARKEAGLSQEQFAEKMSISRSAVAKWESGRGLPDVNNLKVMAQLLDVSVDYLLDEDKKLSFNEVKEAIDLDSFEITGKCRSKMDAACYSKFKRADAIYPLICRKRMSKAEWLVDFIVGPGIIQGADYLNGASAYYLVETGGKQFLVKVVSDFIITSELTSKVDPRKFELGNHLFKKAPYQLI